MYLNIILAAFMLTVTTGIHAGCMMLSFAFNRMDSKLRAKRKHTFRTLQISGVIVLMFLSSFLEALVWALTYLALNAIDGFEKALYFSMATYTTLGCDIFLDVQWRLLSSFESVNGIIMFGWTTAIVIAAVQHLYVNDEGK